MSLQKVYLKSDVYTVCLQHALSTEKEEVMGLLIGEVDEKKCESYISACKILARSDKRPDRVEISPEQLTDATIYAEELSKSLRQPLRVVGWYHSHPHITVWPSHVDLRTQAMYQNMDKMFVGLIFSVFSNNKGSFGGEIQLTCFQTFVEGVEHFRQEIPLIIEQCHLSLPCLESAIALPKILSVEEQETLNAGQTGDAGNELVRLHNNALQTIRLVHITEKVAKPLFCALENRLTSNLLRKQYLETEKKKLLKELGELQQKP